MIVKNPPSKASSNSEKMSLSDEKKGSSVVVGIVEVVVGRGVVAEVFLSFWFSIAYLLPFLLILFTWPKVEFRKTITTIIWKKYRVIIAVAYFFYVLKNTNSNVLF